MIKSKYLPFATAVLLCVCLFVCGFIIYAANTFDIASVTEYQKRMFGEEIITLDIQANKDEWQSMLNNAQAKEWISADIIINGERFNGVGIRTKGNSSLSQMGSSRGGSGSRGNFSLQFKFNKFVKGQNYYGLDTFCVNNMMGDATYMKDYIAYDIMNHIGVDTPLVNYAEVTVNGEDYGFGITLERYDKAFLGRVYSTSAGELYNVKISMGRRGDFEDMWQDVENSMPGRLQRNRGDDMGIGGFDGRNGGGSLVYTDDNISSYSAIFENAVFNPSDKDKQRVITALENLNAGTDLETYLDVDGILRYLAAHTVVVNLDSYTSNMQQNYYIYERDGKLTILPWDYNLSFGGFQSGDASSVVNFPIDTPVSGVSMESRPLLNVLLEVDEYREKYHEYLRKIVEDYFESGLFERTILAVDAKIYEYVKNDPSAFYTYEQYEASLPVFVELGRLRSESIKGQLNGTIPSTSREQNANGISLVEASNVSLSVLGSMMGGGMQGGQDGWPAGIGEGKQPGEWGGRQSEGQRGFLSGEQDNNPQDGGFEMLEGDIDMNLIMQAMQIIMEAGGKLTDEVKYALLQIGLTEDQIEMLSNMQTGFLGGNMRGGEFPNMDRQNPFSNGNGAGGEQADPSQRLNKANWNNDGNMSVQTNASTGYIIFIVVLLVMLICTTIFIAKPRKNTI